MAGYLPDPRQQPTLSTGCLDADKGGVGFRGLGFRGLVRIVGPFVVPNIVPLDSEGTLKVTIHSTTLQIHVKITPAVVHQIAVVY